MPAKPFVVVCGQCRKPFAAVRSNAKYCGDNCRQRARTARKGGGTDNVVDLPQPPAKLTYASRFVQAVRDKLDAAGRGDEPLSLLALSLAEDSVNERLPASARKQFTAEFRATYAEAMRGVKVDSSVDELRRRRDAARTAAG